MDLVASVDMVISESAPSGPSTSFVKLRGRKRKGVRGKGRRKEEVVVEEREEEEEEMQCKYIQCLSSAYKPVSIKHKVTARGLSEGEEPSTCFEGDHMPSQ